MNVTDYELDLMLSCDLSQSTCSSNYSAHLNTLKTQTTCHSILAQATCTRLLVLHLTFTKHMRLVIVDRKTRKVGVWYCRGCTFTFSSVDWMENLVRCLRKVSVFHAARKQLCVKFAFKRSRKTVSKHLHAVLNSVLRLHAMFLTRPQPITEDNTDPRWHPFQIFFPFLVGFSNCVLIGYIFFDTSCMDQFGNQMGHDVERVQVSRGRRSWSKIEEDVLILCLINDVLDGWKSDNGFKAGFQHELEKSMRKIIPTTDLVDNPHINSKIHVWKKEYGVVSDLLSKSGIGWNSTTSMIEIQDEGMWESCKRWIEIFGKDTATGENAVDPIDLINELYRTGMDQEGDTGDKYVPLTPEYMNEMENDVADKPVDLTPKAFTNGKKWKSTDSDITMMVESLGDYRKWIYVL
ncbi:hypothetical protein ACS0TY_027660 [Phlomoides rotata]